MPAALERGNYYLRMAERAFRELSKLRGPALDGGLTRRGKLREPSSHYRHALTCSLFCALAVEYHVRRLIHLRIRFGMLGQQREHWHDAFPDRPRTEDLLKFLRDYSDMPRERLIDIERLMDYRNELVHPEFGGGYVVEEPAIAGGPREWESTIVPPPLTEHEVVMARVNLQAAQRIVEACRKEGGHSKWNPFRSPTSPTE